VNSAEYREIKQDPDFDDAGGFDWGGWLCAARWRIEDNLLVGTQWYSKGNCTCTLKAKKKVVSLPSLISILLPEPRPSSHRGG
jgi:hypothetical protein